MNLLFGLAIGLFSATAFWILCWLIPERVWALLPEEYLSWKDTVIRLIGSVILIVVCWNNLMAYAPRLTLDTTHQPSPPERGKVVEVENVFVSEDRSDMFSDRLKIEKIEKD